MEQLKITQFNYKIVILISHKRCVQLFQSTDTNKSELKIKSMVSENQKNYSPFSDNCTNYQYRQNWCLVISRNTTDLVCDQERIRGIESCTCQGVMFDQKETNEAEITNNISPATRNCILCSGIQVFRNKR